MKIGEVLSVFHRHGFNPRRSGDGWLSRCPAHPDEKPSLSISVGEGGRTLFKCFPGCTAEAVAAAVGLKLSDLFDNDSGRAPRAATPGITTRFEVRDTAGTLHAVQVRTEFVDRGKRISLEGPNGEHKLKVGGAGKLPLFGSERLPALADGETVVVVEGPKKAAALHGIGVAAVASVMGAGTCPGEEALRPLTRFRVLLWADNDVPGARHMAMIADSLRRLGGQPLFVTWPEAGSGEDAVDFIACGGGRDGVLALLATATDKPASSAGAAAGGGGSADGLRATWKPFPVECLPDPVNRFVREAGAALGCDPAYVAVPALAVLAGCIGNRRRLVLKSSWRVPCVLWCAIVGQPGSMKSPALGHVAGPLQAHEAAVVRAYRDEVERSERAAPEGEKPAHPEPPARLLLADITVEAVAKLLVPNPLGLLLVRDELGGWFLGFNAYKSGRGGDCQAWLEMYDAGPLLVDRKGDAMPLSVPRAAVSVIGGVTPEVLRRVLDEGHVGDGLAPRFLFVDPPRARKRWTEVAVTDSTGRAWADLLARLRKLATDCEEDGAPCPRDVSLSPEAKAAWIAWYDRHAERQNEAEGWEASLLSKIESICARLTLVLHVVRAAWGVSDVATDIVDERTVKAGSTLADWFAAEGLRVREALAETAEQRELRVILDSVRLHGGRLSVRDFQRRGPRRYRESAEVARAALDRLVTAGWAEWQSVPPGAAGGAPSEALALRIDGGDGDTTRESPGESEVPSPSPPDDEPLNAAEGEVAA